MIASMALVAVVAVAATFAYLTSTTDVVKNTFTIGKIEITLDETDVDVYGVKDGEARVTENDYKLIPGHEYIKDPTIHVKAGSEACYVFVKVTDEIAAIEDATTVADQITANGWEPLEGQTGVYYKAQPAVTADKDLVVFKNFKIRTDADVSTYDGKTITVIGYAIQQDGFTTAEAAWAAAPSNWGVSAETPDTPADPDEPVTPEP